MNASAVQRTDIMSNVSNIHVHLHYESKICITVNLRKHPQTLSEKRILGRPSYVKLRKIHKYDVIRTKGM